MKTLIHYSRTPQVIALEYEEQRDLQKHPDKAGYYAKLVAERTRYGKEFVTKADAKEKKRRNA